MELCASNLKQVLWHTLQALKEGSIDSREASGIATQSREIVRVIKSQQSILQQANKSVTEELVDYATK